MDQLKAAVSQVEGLMQLVEGTAVIRQATGAYRDQLVSEEGFSDATAEEMAVEFHAMTMAMFRQKVISDMAAKAPAGGRPNRADRRRR
jgi:hypothetical protein